MQSVVFGWDWEQAATCRDWDGGVTLTIKEDKVRKKKS